MPPERLIGDASTELVPAPDLEAKVPAGRFSFLDTLAEPNIISVDASEHRAAVATRAGVLSPALDAAASAQAKNSIECGQRAGRRDFEDCPHGCGATPPDVVPQQFPSVPSVKGSLRECQCVQR